MSIGEYVPGTHLAVVDVHGVALLPASTSDQVLASVRAALSSDELDGDRVTVLLETLTLGTRLSVLPAFAAAVLAPGRVDLLVRGPYRLTVAGARPTQLDGLHVTSWREESVDEPTLVELAGDEDTSARTLTLDRGVALAASVRLLLAQALESDAPSKAEKGTVAEPVADELLVEPVDQAPTGQSRHAGPVSVDSSPEPRQSAPATTAGQAATSLVPGDAAASVGSGDAGDGKVSGDGRTLLPDATLAVELTGAGETASGQWLVTGVPGPIAPSGTDQGQEGSSETDYGFLWDHTIIHDVEHAAVRAPDHEPDHAPAAESGAGDHDGETIHLSDLLGSAPAPVPAPQPADISGPGVLSRYCGQGHPNAPHAVACRVCGGPIVGEPRVGTRPALGRLRLGSGDTVDLDRSVILGRRPQAARVSQGDIPRLVAVGGKEVSRSHLELRLEDWNVLAVELGSRNGTLLLRPGQPPVRLVENNPVPVRSGDQFDLGEGIVVTAEDVP
ncbi:FHA domain protein [mine drainage metagenome]|uniref:FHA domain protein n=1 Tax=mine drainage metagenome TaxID=410659 RepID=A0A1J5RBI5_9ZZZZ